MQSDLLDEDESEGYDSDEERPEKPLKPESRWVKRDPFGNFVDDNIVFNTELTFAKDFDQSTNQIQYPEKGTDHSAGYDIVSNEDKAIPPGKLETISTGLKMIPPYGYYGQLMTRSSMAKKDLLVVGGVIDWDYRGEIKVMIRNFGNDYYHINSTDKIAQLLILPTPNPEVNISSIRSYDQQYGDMGIRKEGGFGSTG
ncbi:dUTPase-like protein [Wolfiporia cocos MD-104 SS10]|uniref:Deoxyuridine 5'-triphosphate nucleotidohydrolase n=1 Tax=Wolfiporia cocos (strain MD-104) TaxID=742152 RepID=A0A2H3JRL8_WOLCO|nr:dUTPase-like protein [Wolfiporia cocos MD-104 SS10]